MTVRIKGSKNKDARKAKINPRIVIILFLFIVSPLACTPPIITPAVTSTARLEPTVTETASPPPTLSPSTPETASPVATTGTPTSDNSLTVTTDADARVKESDPDTNYGDAATLQSDDGSDPGIESFIRFTVTGVSDTVLSARLRVYATDNGSADGPAVHLTDLSWAEMDITWNNRPARTSAPVDNKDRIGTETWVEYDVTSLVTGDGIFSFVLASDSSDSVVFSSREGNQPPELVITFGKVLTPTPSPTLQAGAVTFVGAGDISECDSDNDELTAQLLDTIPGTVFTTGDNAYDSGTHEQYRNCYDPTWGRHRDRTKPVPGNHEYRTSRADGYFQYFNNIPSYYAYDLGSWRIYALNSEIDVSADSAQLKWLQDDLAANPKQCVLAYWHKPRWSSGANHGSDTEIQTLWQVLYEAGAEVVLNGHEHNYERFAPMNSAGQADPLGLREFVVGTGGKTPYDFDTALPTSEVRNSTAFGVLKLTLRTTGYDWEFVPVTGSTFTDSGSTDCH